MRKDFEMGAQTIAPGKRATVEVTLPNQSSYTPITMPVHVIHGRQEGPVIFVSAAVHGDEINGVEIVRRLLKSSAIKGVKGTVIFVPIVNVYGFINHSRYLPDGRDLNRSFPGSEHGSLASRLAFTFANEILRRCDYGIDLHTGGGHRTNYPHIRANLDSAETAALAQAFGTPVIIDSDLRDGSLRSLACEIGVKMLLYEAGGALRFEELPIRGGVRGVLNILRFLDMISPSKRKSKAMEPLLARSSSWLRAPQSGILRIDAVPGAHVEAGTRLGVVADAVGKNEAAVQAPYEAIVIGRTNLPAVNEGDALFHLARFGDTQEVATAVEAFHAEHLEGLGQGDFFSE